MTRALANLDTTSAVAPTWVKLGGAPQRAFVCRESCRLAFELPPGAPDEGWTLRLQTARWAPQQPAGGRFRIALDGEVVHEAAGQHGRRNPVAVKVPASATELVLEAEVDGQDAQALWIDPLLETSRPREGDAPEGAWNLLVVTSDTTRADDLSIYGGPVAMRALEGLAAEGVRFDDLHSVAFGTLPSHASLFTSQYAREHGAVGNGWRITSATPTLAEHLRGAGWATAAFVSSQALDHRLGIDRGFDRYDEPHGLQRRGDRTVALAERWLESAPAQPFFLFVHLYDPHQPYAPQPDFAGRHGSGADEASVGALLERLDPRGGGRIDADAVERADAAALPAVDAVARARYRDEIAFVDAQLERLLAGLEAGRLLDRTLVVFTADHGENFLDRGVALAFDHAGLNAEVTRLPLVLRFPDGRRAGTTSAEMRGSLDVAPTLLKALGVEAPPGWRGRSLFEPPERDYLLLEASHAKEIGVRTKSHLYRSMQAPWFGQPRPTRNLGYAPGAPEKLFARVPGGLERRDVFAPDHPALSALRARVDAFVEQTPRARTERLGDETHLEALRALGYVVEEER